MTPQMIYGIVLTALPILMSLSIHEFAHARTALAFGDPTAKAMGRCTLNPLAHLHPIGTMMMVFAGFGWARPVPVNPMNLRPRRLGDVAVSAAGPASNLAVAIVCGLALRIMVRQGVTVNPGARFAPTDLPVFLLMYTAMVNLTLCIFNLIPLFPLDGHHIGRETLPARHRAGYMQWQMKYGMWLFIALWVGPMVLWQVAQIRFNPLGRYIAHVLWPTLKELLGPTAFTVGWQSMDKFAAYLMWW